MIKEQSWIIVISGDVYNEYPITYMVYGNKEQVKQHLVRLVLEERESFRKQWHFDDGTDSIERIKSDGNRLLACGHYGIFREFYCYHKFNRYYSATPIPSTKRLDSDGAITEQIVPSMIETEMFQGKHLIAQTTSENEIAVFLKGEDGIEQDICLVGKSLRIDRNNTPIEGKQAVYVYPNDNTETYTDVFYIREDSLEKEK